MKPAPVGLGDVFRAIAAIAPDKPAHWPAIAATLGFALPQAAAAGGVAQPVTGHSSAGHSRPREIVLDEAVARQESSLPVLAPRARSATGGRPSPFLLSVQTLPQELPNTDAPSAPGLMPLFEPATTASLLRATVLMPEPRGRLDVAAIAGAVARRRPLARLPRLPCHVIARDVVVLQDLGEGMDAFIDDVELFIGALQQVTGHSALRVGGFLGSPTEALAELGCHRGTAVVVLSDLGLGRLARPDERGLRRWIELAETTRRIGARVTALVPWPAGRWPPALAARLALVTWDRTTSVAQVMRAVRAHG